VFETARAFLRRDGDADDAQPEEPWFLTAVAPAGAAADEGRAGFLRLKAVLDRVAHALAVPALDYRRATSTLFHPGRTASVHAGAQSLGFVGEVHPAVLRQFDLAGRVVGCEIDLDLLLAARTGRQASELARFPAVERDLNVVVAEDVPAAEMLATIRAAGGDLLESVRAFDEYRGPQVGAGLKSLAFALTFRSPERTLTDSEVDQTMQAIRAALQAEQRAAFRV
jgi:phenylalanyl-tRNA synthetase beta chain